MATETLFGVSQSSFLLLHQTKLAHSRRSPAIFSIAERSPISVRFSSALRAYNRSHLCSAIASDTKSLNDFTADSTSKDTGAELDTGGGSGGGIDGSGGGDGGGGGGGGGGGEEDSHEEGKKKMAMSMSQKLTLGYAALIGVGGLMGYLKTGSEKSLLAGGISASLLYYVFTQLPTKPVFASSMGLVLSAALLFVMGSRFRRSGKIFPAGVVSVVSIIMTGGYLHGIMRSAH